jgi:hypothetical protein
MESGASGDDLPEKPWETVLPRKYECNTLQDLQTYLQEAINANSTALIPDRVAAEFYLASYITFKIPIAQEELSPAENGDSANSTPDPSSRVLGSVARGPHSNRGSAVEKDVSAFEALTNQPVTVPRLQGAVARSIVASIAEIDGFGWTLRHRNRTMKMGWVFNFVCQDSLQNRDRLGNRLRKPRTGDPDRPELGKSEVNTLTLPINPNRPIR